MSCSDWPLRERDADLAVAAQVAGAGQHQIAKAGQAGQRVALRAERHRQPRELGETARDQRGQRVVAEPEAFDDAGRDRDDVLQRAAKLDADDIAAAVEAQRRRPEVRHHGLDDRGRIAGRHQRRRQLARQLAREARTRQHDDVAGSRQFLPQHLRHAQQRRLLRVPSSRSRSRSRGQVRVRPRATSRTPCDGTAITTNCAPSSAIRRSAVGDNAAGSIDARAGRRGSRASRPCRRPAPRRAPTAARRGPCAPGARPARCPSFPIR